ITAFAVIFAIAAWQISYGRRDANWTQAFVMVSLVALLLLGLWLPIASWIQCHGSYQELFDPQYALARPVPLVLRVVVPPLAAAIGYVAFAICRPDAARRMRTGFVVAVAFLFVVATVIRLDAHPA